MTINRPTNLNLYKEHLAKSISLVLLGEFQEENTCSLIKWKSLWKSIQTALNLILRTPWELYRNGLVLEYLRACLKTILYLTTEIMTINRSTNLNLYKEHLTTGMPLTSSQTASTSLSKVALVSLIWSPVHIGIPGNSCADKLARLCIP